MAAPMSASALVRALRAEGCRVEEYRDWRTHNRNHKGAWGPINGVMIHHTVTSGTEGSVRLCYEGYSSLPGPLCHGVIAKNGTVYLVGNGRANHAGLGDDDVLRAVIAERSTLPEPNERNTDGNARFYGFECINLGDGEDPWPKAQLEAIERASAAICRHYGWKAESVIGHKEWSYTKVDPRGFSMEGMRRRIQDRLDAGPDDPSQEEDMPQTLSVGLTRWTEIPANEWTEIRFDAEWRDPRHDHWDQAGSQFVRGPAAFTGTLHLRADGLPVSEQLQTRLVRVVDERVVQTYEINEVHGTTGDSFAAVSLTGDLGDGDGVRVQVYHWQDRPIRIKAYVKALVWGT